MPTILLADSGSTKTSWKYIHDGTIDAFETKGINPNYLSTDTIELLITKEVKSKTDSVDVIHFYGSGCSSELAKNKLSAIFKSLFNSTVTIYSDLEAACIALSSQKQSWVCILGTGSNACVYDHDHVSFQSVSLGYLLGDEGSGADIGKRLLKAYYQNGFPKHLHEKWEEKYSLSYQEVITTLYNKEKPNTWLASFTYFAKEYINEPIITAIVKESFTSFLQEYILCKKEFINLPVNFVGSIAYQFKDILSEVLQTEELKLGSIVQSPIEELTEKYSNGELKVS